MENGNKMKHKKRNIEDLELLGGRLCLDFVNTLDWRGRESPQEFLYTYNDLMTWSRHVGLIKDREAQVLRQQADKSPSEAKRVLSRAVELRETIYRLFSAATEGVSASNKDLTAFNKYLSHTMRQSRIIETKDGLTWDSDGSKDKLGWILNPVVRSAADLLVSGDLKRVKRCADFACGWLFLDNSRNKSRRWCDMKDCGNRAKASRFYKRAQLS
jgi:predicted RNA-binding Zn ribbon-like protein